MKRAVAIVITILALAAVAACGSTITTRRTSLVTVTVGSDHIAILDVRNATVWARAKLLFSRVFSIPQAVAGLPTTVQSIQVTVTAADMNTIMSTTNVAGQAEASLVMEVPNGLQRHFAVQGLDAVATPLYQGSADADLDGTPVTLTVSMSLIQNTLTILSTVPTAGATAVPISTTVSVLFSDPVDTQTITTTTFTLKDGGGYPVAGAVLASGSTATLTPSASLSYGTVYTAEVTTGVLGLSGKVLAAPYGWSFTTATETIAPTFTGASLATAPTYSTLQLAWSPATDNVTSSANMVYVIYAATSPGGENYASPSYTTTPGVTSYTVTGITPGTPYYFVVRARDEAGNTDTNTVETTAVYPGRYVSASTGTTTGSCTLASPCLTIAFANNLATPSEAVFVAAGSYLTTSFTITTGVVYACTGANHTSIITTSMTSGPWISGSQGSIIDGCTLTAAPGVSSAVNDGGGDMVINNVIVNGSLAAGLALTKNSVVRNTSISGSTSGNGINIAGGSAIVSGCTITGNMQGVNITMGAQTPTPTIMLTTIATNSTGIVVSSGTTTISSNDIYSNSTYGISLTGGTTTISNNTVHGNGTGIYTTGSSLPAIHGNSLYCNSAIDLYVVAPSSLDATNNSWDHDNVTSTPGPTVSDTLAGCPAGVDVCYDYMMAPNIPIYSPFTTAVTGGCL